ncbi:MAG: ArsR/SmtB family transcription factor [Desulfosalsimonas sp.]
MNQPAKTHKGIKVAEMKTFVKVMKALSDSTRIKILKMLQRRQMCVCEIQEALGIAQSTTSKHLKILEEAGLATYKKDGLWVNYTLADGSDSPYAAAMLGNLRHWLEDDPEVAELKRQLPEIRREQICRTQAPRAQNARA